MSTPHRSGMFPGFGVRRWMRFLALALLLIGASLEEGEAQPARPDALFYHEVSTTHAEGESPRGKYAFVLSADALIGLRRIRPDVAQAWYEQLSITIVSPEGTLRFPTDNVLRQLFVLRFDSAGHPTPTRTPVFPEIIAAYIDLTKEFQDFFMPEPRQPLRRGLTWVDTLRVDGQHGINRSSKLLRVGKYEVVGDSTIGGVPVFVVRGTVQHQNQSSGPVPRQPGLRAVNTMDGRDNSRFYIAKDDKRMVARKTTGTVKGFVDYEGDPSPGRMPNTYTYEARIDLVPKPSR